VTDNTAAPAGAPAAPTAAPTTPATPATPAPNGEATAAIAALRADKEFSAKYLSGDKDARARMDALHQQAAAEKGADPAAAQAAPATGPAPDTSVPVEPASDSPGDVQVHAMQAGTLIAGALQEAGIAGLPADAARFYGKALTQGLSNPPSEAAKQAVYESTMSALHSLYAPEKVKQVIADAQASLDEISVHVPQFPKWLAKAGGLSDLHTILKLADRTAATSKARLLAGMRAKR